MPTEMNFGPKWIRDMYGERSVNDGANHTMERSGIQMATHRYGYEEMLGLIPIDLDSFDLLQGQEFHLFEPREPSFRQPVMPVQNADFQKSSFTTSRKMRSGDNEFERTPALNKGVDSFRRMPEPMSDRTTQDVMSKVPPDRQEAVVALSNEPKEAELPSQPVIDIPLESIENTPMREPELVTCEEIEKMLNSHENGDRANAFKADEENDNFFVPESRVGIGIECREVEENTIFNMPSMPSFNFSSLLNSETDNANLNIVEPSLPETIATEVESSSVPAIGPVLNFKQSSKLVQCVGNDPIWHYIDPRGNEQGPFSNESMSKWFDNNYFPDTLPIRTKIQKDFRPLKEFIALYEQAPFNEQCSSHLMFGNQSPLFEKEEEILVESPSRPFFDNHDPINHNHFLPSLPSELGGLNLQSAFPNQFSTPEIPNPQISTMGHNDAIDRHFNLTVSSSIAPPETTVANVTSISMVTDNNSLPRPKKAWDAEPSGAATKSGTNHSDSKCGSKRNQKNAKNTPGNDVAHNSIRPLSNGVEIEDQVNKFFQSFEDTSTNTKSEQPAANTKKHVQKVNSKPRTPEEKALLSSMLENACMKEKSRQSKSEKVSAPGGDSQKQMLVTRPSFIPSLADIQNEQELSYANEPPPIPPVIKKEPRPATSNTSPWNIVHDSYTPIDLSALINSSNGDAGPKNSKRNTDQNVSSIASLVRDFQNHELTLNNQMQYPQIPKTEYQSTAQLSSAAPRQPHETMISAVPVLNSSSVPSGKGVKEAAPKKQGNAANTAAAKKNKKEKQHAKSVKNLFSGNQKSAGNTREDEFHLWCIDKVFNIDTDDAARIDIPTFVEMLKEFDSPYEIHTTIKEYLGDTKECQEFAADFIKRKNKLKPNSMRETEPFIQFAPSVPMPNISPSPAQEEIAPVAPPAKTAPQPSNAQAQKTVLASSSWASANPNPSPFELPKPMDADGNRKKGKQRKGQKINPAALLQISSKPAENRKIGEIDNA